MNRRLFFGLELSDKARTCVGAAAEQLTLEKGRQHERDNYHVTLVFLGETDEAAVAQLEHIARLAWTRPFDMSLSGAMGTFKGGSVIWAGVEKSKALCGLYKRLQSLLQENGFVSEGEAYTPHITVARSASSQGALPAVERAAWTAEHITLFESVREDGVLRYRALRRIGHDA